MTNITETQTSAKDNSMNRPLTIPSIKKRIIDVRPAIFAHENANKASRDTAHSNRAEISRKKHKTIPKIRVTKSDGG